MSQLTPVVDRLLTQGSTKLVPFGYIAEKFLTPMKVKNLTGKIGNYNNGALRIVQTLMIGKGEARRVDSVVRGTDSYSVEPHGLEGVVSKTDLDNTEQPFEARSDEMESLIDTMWTSKEKDLADAVTSTSTMTQNTTLSGTSQFSDFANSDPLGQFLTARGTVRDSIGMKPNLAAMDWAVAEQLRYHPGILEALGFAQNRAGSLTNQELANAMQVERLLIAEAIYNNSNEGQSDSIEPIWGKHIIFAHIPMTFKKKQKTLGYDVTLKNSPPRKVFREKIINPPGSESIIVIDDYDQLLIDVTAGYLIKDAIA